MRKGSRKLKTTWWTVCVGEASYPALHHDVVADLILGILEANQLDITDTYNNVSSARRACSRFARVARLPYVRFMPVKVFNTRTGIKMPNGLKAFERITLVPCLLVNRQNRLLAEQRGESELGGQFLEDTIIERILNHNDKYPHKGTKK